MKDEARAVNITLIGEVGDLTFTDKLFIMYIR